MRRALSIFGTVCMVTWMSWAIVTTIVSMYKVLFEDSPYFTGIFYALIAGFGAGLFLSYLPIRIAQRYELRKSNTQIMEMIERSRRRALPLMKKSREELDAFMKALMDGRGDDAQQHHERLTEINGYIDAALEEEFDLPVGNRKPGGNGSRDDEEEGS